MAHKFHFAFCELHSDSSLIYKLTLFENYIPKCYIVKRILISFNCFSEYMSLLSSIRPYPVGIYKVGHHWPIRDTPFRWPFEGWPIVAQDCVLTKYKAQVLSLFGIDSQCLL